MTISFVTHMHMVRRLSCVLSRIKLSMSGIIIIL